MGVESDARGSEEGFMRISQVEKESRRERKGEERRRADGVWLSRVMLHDV